MHVCVTQHVTKYSFLATGLEGRPNYSRLAVTFLHWHHSPTRYCVFSPKVDKDIHFKGQMMYQDLDSDCVPLSSWEGISCALSR